MTQTHFVDWTIGPDETDVCIEFKMISASFPGYFNPITGVGEGPSGAELEWVDAWETKSEKTIDKDHPLFEVLCTAWDEDDKLYNKAADIAEDYDPTEDWA